MKPDRPDKEALEALLAAVRRGDRESFESLLSIYRPMLLQLCEREMGEDLKRVMEPEDVVQHVLVNAYRGFESAEFPNVAALEGWLGTIARRRIIDLRRCHLGPKRRGGKGRSLEETVGAGSDGNGVHLGDGIPSPDRSPSSIAGRREQAEALEKAISDLPPHFRALLRMILVDQFSIAEISSRIGRSPQAVRKRLERALHAVHDRMVRDGTIRPDGDGRA